MAILEIRKLGDPVLRTTSKEVKRINSSTANLLDDMIFTMRSSRGVGLAAPQVGVSKRMVVVETMEGLFELVNPEIISSGGSQVGLEGCLSIPGKAGEVERAQKVTVSALDRNGRQYWLDGDGFLARVLQHEIDHLDGVLFADKANSLVEIEEIKCAAEPLRILFMGTPEFAILPLYNILTDGHHIVGVVTQPDKPAGRHRVIKGSPVKTFSQKHRLPLFQPESISEPAFLKSVTALKPDLAVVVAFGKILPKAFLEIPKLGTINLHPSLLPKYRGPAPIHWALINGEEVTGVTTMYISEKLDSGDVILQSELPITRNDNVGTLHEKLSKVGAELLSSTISLISSGEAPRLPQDESKATYTPLLKREHEVIDWCKTASDIVNQVRGMDPWPGAYTLINGRKVKIWRAVIKDRQGSFGDPGQVIEDENDLVIATGQGAVMIVEIQPEGKKRMSGAEFLRGYRIKLGEKLGK